MILALEDKSWWDSPASTVDSLNNCDQFTIAWLSLEAPLVFDSADYFGGCSYAHENSLLVKVVDILVFNAVLINDFGKKIEPLVNSLRVSSLGPIVI